MPGQTSVAKKIVLLSASRDLVKLKVSAEEAGFVVYPAASPMECMALVGAKQPDMIVHNLRGFEFSQVNLFHQRLVRSELGAKTKRIVLAPELTFEVLSLVADCGLRKAFQLASALSDLGTRLREIWKEEDNRPAGQAVVHSLRMLMSDGDSEEFDAAVEKAYAAYPHDLIIRLEYGNLCFKRGRYVEARDAALRMVQIEPHNVRAMHLLARAEMKLGDSESAHRLLKAANKVCPHNPDRLTLMGDILLQQGNAQEAKIKYMAAIEVYPKAVQARENLSQCPLTEAEIDYALKIFSEPLSEVERASFLNSAGINALTQNRYQDALKLYQAALDHLTEQDLRASVFYNLALAHRKNRKPEEAIRAFQECLRLNPQHPYAQAHIAEITSAGFPKTM